jgi:hypothetical protein
MNVEFLRASKPPGEAQVEVPLKSIPERDAEPQVWSDWLRDEVQKVKERIARNEAMLTASPAQVPSIATSGVQITAPSVSDRGRRGTEVNGSAAEGSSLQAGQQRSNRVYRSPAEAEADTSLPPGPYVVMIGDVPYHAVKYPESTTR